MLQLDEVSSGYDSIEILHKLSLRVDEGETVCLLGSNGMGKTTTLKTILGLVRARAGTIKFNGEDITRKRTEDIIKLGIGVVPEGRRIFPKMTVEENLKMGALFEKNKTGIKKRMQEIFEIFPRLEERLEQVAGTLSGGEQAMLAMGRALMGRPKLLLLDEPSLGLAPFLVEQMFANISKISRQGTSVLLIEQNAEKALSVSNRGYVLQKGQVAVSGTSAQLMEAEIIKKGYMV